MVVDEAKDVPPLVLLGYAERGPALRVLRLSERQSVVAPLAHDTFREAISDLVPRETWIALDGGESVWSVGIPVGGKIARVAKSFDCRPSQHPDRIWVTTAQRDSGEFREIDGAGVAHRVVVARSNERVDACTPHGLVVRTLGPASDGEQGDDGPAWLKLRDPDTGEDRLLQGLWRVDATRGCTIFGEDLTGEHVLFDVATQTSVPIANPGVAQWQRSPSFSPDGSTIAVGADLNSRSRKSSGDIAELFRPGYQSPPRPSVLVLIDARTGNTRIVDGQFENFAWRPTWSLDGEWLVFGAPFEDRVLYLVRLGEDRLLRIPFRKDPPMPILDTTGTNLLS